MSIKVVPVDIAELDKVVDTLLVEVAELLAQGGGVLPQLRSK